MMMMMGTVEVIVNNHVTPLLRDFHWLKVPERVAYKLVVTVYQCLHGMAPPCLCDDLQRVSEVNRCRLRSSTFNAVVLSFKQPDSLLLVFVPSRSPAVAYGTVCQLTSRPQQLCFLYSFKIILIFCFFPCMTCVRLTLTLFSAFAVCI